MLRKLKVSDLRAVLTQYAKDEVTFSKMVELLNERSGLSILANDESPIFSKEQLLEMEKNELSDKFMVAASKDRELDKLPARVKYYLLDWKDKNLETFIERFGNVSLGSLSKEQLKILFDNAIISDLELLKT